MLNASLIGFVFLGLFSPGPNVILVTTSGARFGFARTLPHIAGIVVGVGIIAAVTGFGIGALLQALPMMKWVLTTVSVIWILYLAYRLWISVPPAQDPHAKPFTFVEAVLFQWVNPKIWAVGLAASAFVASHPPMIQALTLGLTFSTVNIGVCTFWTLAGTLLSVLLTSPCAWTLFNRVMALALVGFSLLLFF